jgi:hypothetical protein
MFQVKDDCLVLGCPSGVWVLDGDPALCAVQVYEPTEFTVFVTPIGEPVEWTFNPEAE